MSIEGIISISGKPGLYRVVTQGRKNLIIEELSTGLKKSAFATDKVSSLNDISIYGYADNMGLPEVFELIYKKEDGKKSIHHKEDEQKIRDYFEEIWPDYDDEQVKTHEIRKIFQWYNLLQEKGLLDPKEETKEVEEVEAE